MFQRREMTHQTALNPAEPPALPMVRSLGPMARGDYPLARLGQWPAFRAG
jgi:hypothetical protein